MKRKIILVTGAIVLLIVIGVLLTNHYYPEEKSFSKTSLLKLNIPLNGESINNIKITNYEETEQNFNVYFVALDGIGSVDGGEFTLGAGEKKEVKVYFKDNKNEVGFYVGQLIIKTETVREEIPVVLGIEDPNYAFAIIQDIISKDDDLYPGGELGVEVKVYDIGNIASPTVAAKYYIKNFDNEVVLSDEVNLVVDGSKTEFIDIPETWFEEDYVFITEIDYRGTKSIAGHLFSITEKEPLELSKNLKFFVVSIVIFIVVLVGLFFYFLKSRDELLMRLKEQQIKELRRNLELVKASKEKISRLEKAPRKRKIRQLKKAKKRIVKSIIKKQKAQRKEFKRLKKAKKKDRIKEKLSSWKQEGYKMLDTKKEIKKISEKVVGRKVKDFKEKGYATGFLKK